MRFLHPFLLTSLIVSAGLHPATAEAPDDPIQQLLAIEPPTTWSAKVHMMIHIGPYTLDMTGDLTAHGNLIKSRLLSGAGGQMIFVKVYTGADGVQWTELSSPPRMKQVIKLDLKQVQEAVGGTVGLNLFERLDGSSTLGVNMGEVWRELLDEFGDNVTVERMTTDDGDVFQINLIFTEDTYDLIDPAKELRSENVTPTVMVIQIGAGDGLIRYMAMLTDEDLFSFEMIFKELVINPEVDPASFEYTPPEGIKIEDITAKAIAERTGAPAEEEVEDFRLIY